MTDSELANDRTFLAWLRTGIALFGLGFVVAKVALIIEPGAGGELDRGLYAGVGAVIILCGAALVLVGYRQHEALARTLREDKSIPTARWPSTLAAGAITASLALSALIMITT